MAKELGSEDKSGIGVTALKFLILYLFVASLTTLWDRDEPRFSRAAVEMVETGDFLVPRFDGELRPDKPPLVYWCMSPWIRLLGANDFAVRIPSVLGSLMMLLATFHIGKNLGGFAVGKRAMILLGCMPLPLFIGTAATADGTLLAGVAVSLAVLVDRIQSGPHKFHIWILTAALSWALLAKGPVGLAAFWLGSLFFAAFGRSLISLDRRWWVESTIATMIAVGIFLAWGIPANIETGGELARLGLGRHVLQRSTEALESHGGSGWLGWIFSLPFYIPVLLLGAAPASALLIPGVLRRGTLSKDSKIALLLCGLILPVLFLMTLVATKLPHYILSAFPGVAVACAWIWTRNEEEGVQGWISSPSGRLGRGLCISLLTLLAVGWLWAVHDISSSVLLALPATGCMAISVISISCWRSGAAFSSFRGPGGSAMLLALSFSVLLLGAGKLEPECKIARPVKKVIESSESPLAPVSTLGYFEPSLVFTLDRTPVLGENTIERLSNQSAFESTMEWIEREGSGWLIKAHGVGEQNQETNALEKEERTTLQWFKRIFNYSNGQRLEIELWLRSS